MRKHTISRNCIECGDEYIAVLSNSRFCGSRCRAAFWRASQRSQTHASTHQTLENDDETSDRLAFEQQKTIDTAAQMQIVTDLLEREADRWRTAYDEERIVRKELENEIKDLENETVRLEHKRALEVLQKEKPDAMERLLSGLGSLPSPILEQLMPLAGRMGNLLLPSPAPTGLSGVGKEIQPIIIWIQGLPKQLQERLLLTLQKVSQLPEADFHRTLDDMRKYLEPRQRIMRPPPDMSIWSD